MARFYCASHRNPESSLFRTGLFSNQLGAQGHSFKSVPNEWGSENGPLADGVFEFRAALLKNKNYSTAT